MTENLEGLLKELIEIDKEAMKKMDELKKLMKKEGDLRYIA